MYEIIYSIPPALEDYYTGLLHDAGTTNFCFEEAKRKLLLKIYSDSSEPDSCIDQNLLSEIRKINESDWKNKWLEDYRGDELTGNIFVLPQGVNPPEKNYRFIIHLDPQDAFGDGHHPTTRICGQFLEVIVSSYKNLKEVSFLDIGTGSGVLAIQAALMGISDIELFDYDSDSVIKANKNLMLNGVAGVRALNADLYKFTTDKKYDIITANLLSRIIEDNLVRLKSFMKPGGFMILSGISSRWANDMSKLFIDSGLKIPASRELDGWVGYLLQNVV